MALPDNIADWFSSTANVPNQPESLKKLGYPIVEHLSDFDTLPPAVCSRVMALLKPISPH